MNGQHTDPRQRAQEQARLATTAAVAGFTVLSVISAVLVAVRLTVATFSWWWVATPFYVAVLVSTGYAATAAGYHAWQHRRR